MDSLTLIGKTDAMVVGTTTTGVSGFSPDGKLVASEARASRLRLKLEGSLPVR